MLLPFKIGFYNLNTYNTITYFNSLLFTTKNNKNNFIFNKIEDLDINNNYMMNDNDLLIYKINDNREEYENNNSSYILKLLNMLYNILINQKNNGITIFNINNTLFKPNIEFIFILTHLFEKIIISKPLASNIFNQERYIVCKHFVLLGGLNNKFNIINIIKNLKKVIHTWEPSCTNIESIIDCEIPLIFLNKISEMNVIISQQSFNLIYQNINILKSIKNRSSRDFLQQQESFDEWKREPYEFIDDDNKSISSKSIIIQNKKSFYFSSSSNNNNNNDIQTIKPPFFKKFKMNSSNDEKPEKKLEKKLEKLEFIKKNNISKCMKWFSKNNLSYNDIF
jgi:hypothetical protein